MFNHLEKIKKVQLYIEIILLVIFAIGFYIKNSNVSLSLNFFLISLLGLSIMYFLLGKLNFDAGIHEKEDNKKLSKEEELSKLLKPEASDNKNQEVKLDEKKEKNIVSREYIILNFGHKLLYWGLSLGLVAILFSIAEWPNFNPIFIISLFSVALGTLIKIKEQFSEYKNNNTVIEILRGIIILAVVFYFYKFFGS